jgi:DNA polymerase
MNDHTRARLEAWLRYYEDLGFPSLYSNRAPATRTPRQPGSSGNQAEEKAAVSASSARAPAAISPLPILSAPSLFDAAEQVEGDTLERIREDLGECTRCRLSRHRTNIVFGVGNPKAELVFVGEGPGHDEDAQGIPFVGRAGRLLTQIIEAMGLRREDVYICNVIKCRPPENRTPEKDEISTCSPFLLRQLAAIRPKVIVCLGNVAAQTLLSTKKSISHYRGQWFDYRGSRLLATYHTAYLLRNPDAKGEVWSDIKKVMSVLGLAPKKR